MEAHDPVAPLLAAIVVPADDELFVALAQLRQAGRRATGELVHPLVGVDLDHAVRVGHRERRQREPLGDDRRNRNGRDRHVTRRPSQPAVAHGPTPEMRSAVMCTTRPGGGSSPGGNFTSGPR